MTTLESIQTKPFLDPILIEAGLNTLPEDTKASDEAMVRLFSHMLPSSPADIGFELAPPRLAGLSASASAFIRFAPALQQNSEFEFATAGIQHALGAVADAMAIGINDPKDALRFAMHGQLAQLRRAAAIHDESGQVNAVIDNIDALADDIEARGASNPSRADGHPRFAMAFEADPIFALLAAISVLQLLLGKVSREQRTLHAEMGFNTMVSAAEKIVEAARANLGGAIGSAIAGGAVTIAGVGLSLKGQARQLKSSRHGNSVVNENKNTITSIQKRIPRPEEVTTKNKSKINEKLDDDKDKSHENSFNSGKETLADRKYSGESSMADAVNKAQRLGAYGMATMSMAMPLSGMVTASGGFSASGHSREEALYRAESDVAKKSSESEGEMLASHNQQLEGVVRLMAEIARQEADVMSAVASNTAA